MKPKILFYDIETAPLKAWVWQLGKQVIRHPQLDKDHSRYEVICIAYCWNDGEPAKSIDWGYKLQDSARVIKQFDKLIKKADFVIGKNNNKFDNKMLNGVRAFNLLPGLPQWTKYSEDLETQVRRYFRLPSASLDYISDQFGLGGKIKMEFQDWIDICERNSNGRTAFEKMIEYNKKDIEDTRTLWNLLKEHFDTKINVATFNGLRHACKNCGGVNTTKNGTPKASNGTRYQEWVCKDCNGRYAGRSTISPINNTLGRVL